MVPKKYTLSSTNSQMFVLASGVVKWLAIIEGFHPGTIIEGKNIVKPHYVTCHNKISF